MFPSLLQPASTPPTSPPGRNVQARYPVFSHVSLSPAIPGLVRSLGARIAFRPRANVPLECATFAASPPGRAHPGPEMIETGDGATEERLTRLLESLRPDLMRFAFWLARDRAVAEDVVQETMLRAWRARSELRDAAATRPWLLTIVRREYARLHERKKLPLVDLDEFVASQDTALALDDVDPEIADLRRAILALPDEYREPIVMQVLGGFTTVEIAQELQLSVPAVLTRLFR